ncbi:MAG: PRD domain-containing protein, partial [Desulfobacterales bacterium]|nr:PRD domain-containing protein [Desulfobacterales bacterium]
MDQLLNQRLDILHNAGEISAEIKMVVMNFVHAFEEKYNLTMTEENASMFITHLAMALARIKRGEEVNPIDEA